MIDYVHAQRNDYLHIQKFIKDNWSLDHSLVKNKKVFSHFFVSKSDPQFFIAKDREGQIIGILGYTDGHRVGEAGSGSGSGVYSGGRSAQ